MILMVLRGNLFTCLDGLLGNSGLRSDFREGLTHIVAHLGVVDTEHQGIEDCGDIVAL